MTVVIKCRLESGRLIPPVPFFFLKIVLAIQGLLCFHTNCEVICSSSMKNTMGSLIGIVLNLQIALIGVLIFTILILPVPFFLKIALALQGLLCFHTNCEVICSSSVKNTIGSFDRDCTESIDCFEYYGHLNNIDSSNP